MTLVVVGAHALDAELMAGAVAATAVAAGRPVHLVHLTRGERGHPGKAPDVFGPQLEQEMREAAARLGCEQWWPGLHAPLQAAEALPQLAEFLDKHRPELVVTHWRGSWHASHLGAHQVTTRALAETGLGCALAYGENCEDLVGFVPTHLVPVSDVREQWLDALRSYELFRRSEPDSGTPAPIPYWAYYTAAARVRAEYSGLEAAQALMVAEGELPDYLRAVTWGRDLPQLLSPRDEG